MSSPEGTPTRKPAAPPPLTRQILLVDDDARMGEMLAEYLAPENYSVHLEHTAESGLRRAGEGGFSLIILDVMLPDGDGFSVLTRIRQQSRIPVIMLTNRASVADKVTGLEAGADDYIPKPFTPVELLARIRTVLRRGQPSRFGSVFVSIDDLTLDSGSRKVERRGEIIDCTAAEFDALQTLLATPGQAVTREQLTRGALGRSLYAGDRGIDNLISALRKKLGPRADGGDRFRSIRNAGYAYLYCAPGEPERSSR